MKKRLKVLVSAYACGLHQGSEPSVGWGWVNAIVKYHDLWVITAESGKGDIEEAIARQPALYRNVHFHYIPRVRRLKMEKFWPPSYHWTYKLWQKAAYKMGCELHEKICFDLVHHLTYVGFREPGYLWKLDIPFVWGPIGGLENTPWRFLPVMGLQGAIFYAGRNIINYLHKKFLPRPKQAFQKARGGIIAATEGIRREILRRYGENSEVICETGPPPGVIATNHSVRSPGEPLRLAWSGLHDPAKALPLLLNAIAMLAKEVIWQLDILGDGPCTKKWKKQAMELGISNRCIWHGWLSRECALELIRRSHIFVITSIKDLTSTVLLEALSQGIPVVCPDHCGFADVVTKDCGVKVPIENLHQFQAGLSYAIKVLEEDEEERSRLAEGALRRILDYSWEKKAERLNEIYERTLGERE